MNILYLINYAGKAGTERYDSRTLCTFCPRRARHAIWPTMFPGQLSETVSSEGFACFRFEMSTKKALSPGEESLQAIARENKIDVIHAQYPIGKTSSPSCPGFSYRKVKVVYTSHLTIYQNTKWKILNRLFTPFDHRIIAVCRQGADIMISNGVKKDRIQVVLPAQESNRSASACMTAALPVSSEITTIPSSCPSWRAMPRKRVCPFLLASLAKLRRKTDKPFVCFIAGDGEEFDDFAVIEHELRYERLCHPARLPPRFRQNAEGFGSLSEHKLEKRGDELCDT